MVDTRNIKIALDKMLYVPQVDEIHVAEDSSFDRDLERIVTESFNIEPSDHKMSLETLTSKLFDYLCDALEESEQSDHSALEIFLDYKGDFFRETIGRDVLTYDVFFPVHTSISERLEPETRFLGHTASVVSDTKIEQELDKTVSPGLERDTDVAKELFLDYDATFWRIPIKARDSSFAYQQARTLVKYFFGKLNFLVLRWTTCKWSAPAEMSQSHAPGMREPPGYLIAIPKNHQIDYDVRMFQDGREEIDRPSRHRGWELEGYDTLPSLPSLSECSGRDESIYVAFTSYQEGVSTDNTNRAFFAFWRGLEALGRSDVHSNEELVERARKVLYSVSGKNIGNPEHRTAFLELEQPRIRDAIDGIADRRNTMVHGGPHIGIQPTEATAVKSLLEAYIEVYIEFYEQFDSDSFQAIIDGLAMTKRERRERISELQNRIDLLSEAADFDRLRDSMSRDHLDKRP